MRPSQRHFTRVAQLNAPKLRLRFVVPPRTVLYHEGCVAWLLASVLLIVNALSLSSLRATGPAVVCPPSWPGMADAGSSRDTTSGAQNRGAGDKAALDKLVERALAADASTRCAFAASLWKRAAVAAFALHGGENLVVARCTLEQSVSLCNQAHAEASRSEQAALRTQAWALASSVLPLLSTRMDDNTLLPGRCTKEEVEFNKRFELAKHKVCNFPPWSARGLQLTGLSVGYVLALYGAHRVLCQLFYGPRPPPAALAFVLRAVDMVCPARHAGFVHAA